MIYQVCAAVVDDHADPSRLFVSSFCVVLIRVIAVTIDIIPYAVEKLNILCGTKMLLIETGSGFGDRQEQTKFSVSSAIGVVAVQWNVRYGIFPCYGSPLSGVSLQILRENGIFPPAALPFSWNWSIIKRIRESTQFDF